MCSQQSNLSSRTTLGFNFYTNNKKFAVCVYIFGQQLQDRPAFEALLVLAGNVYVAMGGSLFIDGFGPPILNLMIYDTYVYSFLATRSQRAGSKTMQESRVWCGPRVMIKKIIGLD